MKARSRGWATLLAISTLCLAAWTGYYPEDLKSALASGAIGLTLTVVALYSGWRVMVIRRLQKRDENQESPPEIT